MTRQVRVLQLIDSLARGGAEQSLVTLAPHLVARGVDVKVAYLSERADLRAELEDVGVHVQSLSAAGMSRRRRLSFTEALIHELRPDVVHTTLFEADLAGRRAAARAGVPCISSLVNTAYGSTEVRRDGLKPLRVRAAHAADMLTARRVTRFHALTHHVATVMAQRLRIPADKIEVIPRGRDAAQIGRRSAERRMATRHRLGISSTVPLLLVVGRQEPQKGHDVLIRALPAVRAHYPEVRVIVAGREGRATEQLAELVASMELAEAVRFLGARDDVPDLLAAADVLVYPSLWEGAGGTLLEAMALECPIVTSRLPVLLESVDDSTAELVSPGDVHDLTRGILAVLASPNATARRARDARKRFEQEFVIEISAHRMADLYRRVGVT